MGDAVGARSTTDLITACESVREHPVDRPRTLTELIERERPTGPAPKQALRERKHPAMRALHGEMIRDERYIVCQSGEQERRIMATYAAPMLGLAEVYGIVRRHRVRVAQHAVPGRCTAVHRWFPTRYESPRTPSPVVLRDRVSHRLLIVDDHDDEARYGHLAMCIGVVTGREPTVHGVGVGAADFIMRTPLRAAEPCASLGALPDSGPIQ